MLLSPLRFAIRWFVPLAIVMIVAAIAAVIFSAPSFITPKYQSQVVLFPTATSSIARAVISMEAGQETDVMMFGEEEEVDQLLQILQSNDISSYIWDKYNLLEHYDIDTDEKYPYTRLSEEFQENVDFRRTEFMSVEISVMDKDPVIAASIANDLARLLDSTKSAIQQQRAREALAIAEAQYVQKQQQIRGLVDSLQALGDLGVMNYAEQTAAISDAYFTAINHSPEQAERLREQMSVLAKYGPVHERLSNQLEWAIEDMANLEQKYEQARVDATEKLTNIFVVNWAAPAEKKVYPRRSLVVLASIFGALLFGALIFAVVDSYPQMVTYVRDTRSRKSSE